MDTIDTNTSSDLVISEGAKMHLMESAKWAKFLAIVGFVMLGLMVVAALFMFTAGASLSRFGGSSPIGAPFAVVALVYIIMAVLLFFPTLYMLNFANKFKAAITNSSQTDLNAGFEYMKSYYKFVGIFTIIVLSIYILMFLIGLAGIAAMS